VIPVDFVLESGNGELDGTVNMSLVDGQSENVHSFADRNEVSSSEASAHPGPVVQEAVHIPNHRLDTDRYELTTYRSSSTNPGPQARTRSWPLRDPEEASLLVHFVDNISSFVSRTVACGGRFPSNNEILSLTVPTDNSILLFTYLIVHGIVTPCLTRSWHCPPVT
jgi:hypothetical protein